MPFRHAKPMLNVVLNVMSNVMSNVNESLLLHSAFYRFVKLTEPEAVARLVQQMAAGLQGSIVLANEGINGVVAGAPGALQAFEAALCSGQFAGGAFKGMAFKHSACSTAPFGRLKVSVKPEIVTLALPGAAGPTAPDETDASHLSPPAWREMLARGGAVILDNRNHFEFRLGHFKGATDPQVHNFRDFVAYVQAKAPAWRETEVPVAMYCTGGIRCDKTAPWLRSLGLRVWQLQGGVLNYFAQTQDAAQDWSGECFVFDNRVALDTRLQETTTVAEQVFDDQHPDEAWRLKRAKTLDESGV